MPQVTCRSFIKLFNCVSDARSSWFRMSSVSISSSCPSTCTVMLVFSCPCPFSFSSTHTLESTSKMPVLSSLAQSISYSSELLSSRNIAFSPTLVSDSSSYKFLETFRFFLDFWPLHLAFLLSSSRRFRSSFRNVASISLILFFSSCCSFFYALFAFFCSSCWALAFLFSSISNLRCSFLNFSAFSSASFWIRICLKSGLHISGGSLKTFFTLGSSLD